MTTLMAMSLVDDNVDGYATQLVDDNVDGYAVS